LWSIDLDENLECENGPNFFSYPHEIEDLLDDAPCQNLELFYQSFENFERVNFEKEIMDFPSSHEDETDFKEEEKSALGSFLEENEVEWLLRDLLGPLDFSRIQGYPNNYQDWRDELPRFHGLGDSPFSHISSFIDVISKLNISHEYVKTKMFILSLDFVEDEIMD
jgi:hypothetical protein